MTSVSTPSSFRCFAVPLVATIVKPLSFNCLAAATISFLSSSFTLINTLPLSGSFVPAAICAFANALPKSSSIPMTSPVDFISGPRMVSTPGNLINGKTDSFTDTY